MKSPMWFLKGIVCVAALTSSLALAGSSGGHELGNGGDVFVCPGNKVEMVDVYEARIVGRNLDFGPEGADYKTKLQAVFSRWSKVSPLRMKRYQEWLSTFESESRFIPSSSLPNVGDEGIISIPQGCEIRQVAIQLADQDLGSFYKRYTITKDLWDRMDENNRAAMVLHELIFREAIESKHRMSLRVRYLNGILWSNSTLDEYVQASAALNGLFLEWGWAGFERHDDGYRNFANYKITADTFIGEVRSNSIWFRNESIDFRGEVSNEGGDCDFVNISRKDETQFIRGLASQCPLYGSVLIHPDNKALYMLSVKIENQTRAVRFDLNGSIYENFQISQIDPSAKVSWHGWLFDTTCTGLDSMKWNEGKIFSGASDSGSGQCTVSKGYKNPYSFQSFHQLSFELTESDSSNSDWLKVLTYDGARLVRFELGQSSVQCEPNPADPYGYQNCKGIPSELTCEIPVMDRAGEVVRTRTEKVSITDATQLRSIKSSSNGSAQATFELLAPKGQVYRYEQGFFKDTPRSLDQVGWMSIRFDEGKCIGTGEFHK